MAGDGRLLALIERFAGRRVACVGDVMLDRYVYGRAERMSPEAPIPVLAIHEERKMLGGAGNVARNVASLGGRASLIGVVGDDEAGTEILRLLRGADALDTSLVTVQGRATTVKTRFVAGVQQLLRADQELTAPVAAEVEDKLIAAALDEIDQADAALLSDYAKGALGPRLISAVIARAKERAVPVVADPKGGQFARFRGATVLKPNARELAAATGLRVASDEDIAAAARRGLALAETEALVVTRSEHGMTLVERGTIEIVHLRTHAQEVFDVSGAGDTALAVLGLALAAGAAFVDAAALANAAAGVVVGKAGTASLSPEELAAALHTRALEPAEAKILPLATALDRIAGFRARGLTIGFSNGCFDLIHAGHVSLLSRARAACGRLVVGLNTDASVRALKGEGRPINPEMARALVLASLESVDLVVLFAEDTPMKLIEAIRPDVLVKGADYTLEGVVGAPFVQSYGGRVMLVELKPGHSTTGTLARLKAAQKAS
jgi:D-beta-D-heptose 7-phosphate kinase/D-beta-D-heptose 1-phosphate adenosyltransferase